MDEKNIFVIKEDFSEFKTGAFPYDREHSAMGEYHLVKYAKGSGIWTDLICNYTYNGPSWLITEKDGKHLMEQMRVDNTYPHRMHPILTAGEAEWKNYRISAELRMYNTSGSAGIAVCVKNTLNLIAVVFRDQKLSVIRRHKQEETIIGEVPCAFSCDSWYNLAADINGTGIDVSVNGVPVLSVTCEFASSGGKIGLTADRPTAYSSVQVAMSEAQLSESMEEKACAAAGEKKLQGTYPEMKLVKVIDLKNFGSGRQIRFGHLVSPDQWNIVFVQCQKRIYQDAYAMISCMTAIDLDGNIIWQWGEPSEDPDAGMLSADLPVQLYDINQDGLDEVIFGRDFEISVLNGKTGKLIRKTRTPFTPEPASELLGIPYGRYAFDRLNPDCIRICNVSGGRYPSDILIKDRYSRIYVMDRDFNLLWKYHDHKNTGHFPYPHDFNGDGKDEIFCGYNMIGSDGRLMWTLPVEADHTDEIVIGKFRGDGRGYLALASGSDGFILADLNGTIIARDDVGHAQRISVGPYRGEPGKFGICLVNYWGHQGIIYFYDTDGKLLWEKETGLNGQILTPVNWKGDGTELILINADTERGGLIDGDGKTAVKFPDDGHPELCVEALNLFGDSRDEILAWDRHRMFIYTQNDMQNKNDYRPVRYPLYAMSNYRGEYSYPDESYITF